MQSCATFHEEAVLVLRLSHQRSNLRSLHLNTEAANASDGDVSIAGAGRLSNPQQFLSESLGNVFGG
jgi:hypothetical protein